MTSYIALGISSSAASEPLTEESIHSHQLASRLKSAVVLCNAPAYAIAFHLSPASVVGENVHQAVFVTSIAILWLSVFLGPTWVAASRKSIVRKTLIVLTTLSSVTTLHAFFAVHSVSYALGMGLWTILGALVALYLSRTGAPENP